MKDQFPNWRKYRACRDQDTQFFFPRNGQGRKKALAICATCPVRINCLNFAIQNLIYDGIWGGTTESKRKPLIQMYVKKYGIKPQEHVYNDKAGE
jgi:WhiB family transcriptional regulator, redox-sensing transcriptional regulator